MAENAPAPRTATNKEALFFLEILGNLKTTPDVDWDTVAKNSGYANASSAKVRFGQIKKCLGWTATNKAGKSAAVAKPKPKTAGSNGSNKVVKKRSPKKEVKFLPEEPDEKETAKSQLLLENQSQYAEDHVGQDFMDESDTEPQFYDPAADPV